MKKNIANGCLKRQKSELLCLSIGFAFDCYQHTRLKYAFTVVIAERWYVSL